MINAFKSRVDKMLNEAIFDRYAGLRVVDTIESMRRLQGALDAFGDAKKIVDDVYKELRDDADDGEDFTG